MKDKSPPSAFGNFLIPAAFGLAALALLGEAYFALTSGQMPERCLDRNTHKQLGALCTQGPRLGTWLFSEQHRHLGYVLLCGLLALFLMTIAWLAHRSIQQQSVIKTDPGP